MIGKKEKNTPEIPKYCCYCENATLINDENNVLCSKKGIVNNDYKCRKFVYDPLKRKPRPLPPLPTLDAEDIVM